MCVTAVIFVVPIRPGVPVEAHQSNEDEKRICRTRRRRCNWNPRDREIINGCTSLAIVSAQFLPDEANGIRDVAADDGFLENAFYTTLSTNIKKKKMDVLIQNVDKRSFIRVENQLWVK